MMSLGHILGMALLGLGMAAFVLLVQWIFGLGVVQLLH